MKAKIGTFLSLLLGVICAIVMMQHMSTSASNLIGTFLMLTTVFTLVIMLMYWAIDELVDFIVNQPLRAAARNILVANNMATKSSTGV